ncbi:MAG: hypothetical protein LC793_15010 [Thermomicrobia bacterium]|nr:hypothetical protein [Thermomicrobia bacterium]
MKKVAARRVRMIVVLALILIGAIALPRLGNESPPGGSTPVATPISVQLASNAFPTATAAPTLAPTPVPTIVPPVVPLVAARAIGLRETEPTATPVPPTPTPAPVVANGPLLTSRLVTFYGHPDNNLLGILGEFATPAAMIAKLKAQTAAYQAADPSRPAIPTIELIASVASDTPGDDGLYLNPTRLSLIEEYAQIAEQNHCLLLLDIQLGYDTIEHEVTRLAPILKHGYVHLAIDPEFHVKRGEIPGEEFGSLTAAEVATAAKMLADIVTQNGLPDKVLVIHQFRDDMLPDKEKITPVPHVQMAIVMDGFGGPGAKSGNYTKFVHDELIQYGGIKLFYKQDKPLMTPADIVALDPSPLVIIYQ